MGTNHPQYRKGINRSSLQRSGDQLAFLESQFSPYRLTQSAEVDALVFLDRLFERQRD